MNKNPVWYVSVIDRKNRKVVYQEMFCTRNSARIYVNTCKRFSVGAGFKYEIRNMSSAGYDLSGILADS